MTLNQATGTFLRYLLLSSSDGKTPVTGLTAGQCVCRYARGSDATLHTYSFVIFQELGQGWYQIFLGADAFDMLGAFTSTLYASGTTVPYWREDLVVLGAAASQGARVTFLVSGTPGQVGLWGGDPEADLPIPLPGVHVQVRDATGSFAVFQGITGQDGRVDTMLSPGEYLVYAWASGYVIDPFPADLVVSGSDMSTQFTATPFTPSLIGGPDMVTVTGALLDSSSVARAGVTITFAPILESVPEVEEERLARPFVVHSANQILSRQAVSVVTASNGSFSIALIPNASLDPAGTRYKVTFSDSVVDVAFVTVPTSPASVTFESLLQ